MTAIGLWYLCGVLGMIPILFVAREDKQDVTVGDVISLITTPLAGPLLIILVLFSYFFGEERPKWESKVIYRRKK